MSFVLGSAATRSAGADGTMTVPGAVGDLVLLQMSTNFDGSGFNSDYPGQGFTFIRQEQISGGTFSSLWRKQVSSVGQSITVYRGTAGMFSFSGGDTTNPLSGSNGQANTSSTTATSPGVTPTNANSLIVLFFETSPTIPCNSNTAAIATSSPTFTDMYNVTGSTAGSIYAAAGQRAATTATGNGTATIGASSANTGQMVVINPGASTANFLAFM